MVGRVARGGEGRGEGAEVEGRVRCDERCLPAVGGGGAARVTVVGHGSGGRGSAARGQRRRQPRAAGKGGDSDGARGGGVLSGKPLGGQRRPTSPESTRGGGKGKEVVGRLANARHNQTTKVQHGRALQSRQWSRSFVPGRRSAEGGQRYPTHEAVQARVRSATEAAANGVAGARGGAKTLRSSWCARESGRPPRPRRIHTLPRAPSDWPAPRSATAGFPGWPARAASGTLGAGGGRNGSLFASTCSRNGEYQAMPVRK